MRRQSDEEGAGIAGAPESETPPFRHIEGDTSLGVLLLCDHASNALPPRYGTLGLESEALNRHIGYDIGAAKVTEQLAQSFGVPAFITSFSRLLIDPNRGLDDPTLIMQLSDGIIIPGNAQVTPAEREGRIARYYAPYHDAISRWLDSVLDSGKAPVVLAIHSFTPAWKSVPRPWGITVLWDTDPRLALPMLDALRAMPDIVAGENVPYSGALAGDTLSKHGTERGLAHVLIELRQDLILGEEGQAEWAERLATVLRQMLANPDIARSLHRVEHYPSRCDVAGPRPFGDSTPQNQPASDIETALEAAVFRRLVAHLRARTDVQNIDLMQLAGFCRNCLSNWYREAAAEKGITLSKDEARKVVYGMAYDAWKTLHQKDDAKRDEGV